MLMRIPIEFWFIIWNQMFKKYLWTMRTMNMIFLFSYDDDNDDDDDKDDNDDDW